MEFLVAYYAFGWVIFLSMAKYGNETEISVCDTFMLVMMLPSLCIISASVAPFIFLMMGVVWCFKKVFKKKIALPSMPSCPIIRIRL